MSEYALGAYVVVFFAFAAYAIVVTSRLRAYEGVRRRRIIDISALERAIEEKKKREEGS